MVDVANVMGSRPDGWWRDRAGAAVRLYSELAALAASGRVILPGPTGSEDGGQPPEIVMVLEGAARAAAARITSAEATRAQQSETGSGELGETGPGQQSAAARGQQGAPTGPGQAPPGPVRVVEARGSGDDAIVALVRELPGRRAVVTSDRELRDRCAATGAAVLGPAWLLGLLRQ